MTLVPFSRDQITYLWWLLQKKLWAKSGKISFGSGKKHQSKIVLYLTPEKNSFNFIGSVILAFKIVVKRIC